MKPTDKQVKFAKDIAKWLYIDLPKQNTSVAYSKFISEHITEFYTLRNFIGGEKSAEDKGFLLEQDDHKAYGKIQHK